MAHLAWRQKPACDSWNKAKKNQSKYWKTHKLNVEVHVWNSFCCCCHCASSIDVYDGSDSDPPRPTHAAAALGFFTMIKHGGLQDGRIANTDTMPIYSSNCCLTQIWLRILFLCTYSMECCAHLRHCYKDNIIWWYMMHCLWWIYIHEYTCVYIHMYAYTIYIYIHYIRTYRTDMVLFCQPYHSPQFYLQKKILVQSLVPRFNVCRKAWAQVVEVACHRHKMIQNTSKSSNKDQCFLLFFVSFSVN